jgi:hypothetical protein
VGKKDRGQIRANPISGFQRRLALASKVIWFYFNATRAASETMIF